MLTPLHAIVGLWLAAWPAIGAGPAPVSVVPDSKSPAAARPADSPAALLELSDDDLLARIVADPGSLGSLSIGRPGRATLFNAVALPVNPRWEVLPNADTWATSETLAAIQNAVDTVHDLFPDTPPIMIGDISGPTGGRLHRHQTHQGGRDVDFGFYYKAGKATWFAPGSSLNLDLARNWALVRALVTRTDVETILLDTRIQRSLYGTRWASARTRSGSTASSSSRRVRPSDCPPRGRAPHALPRPLLQRRGAGTRAEGPPAARESRHHEPAGLHGVARRPVRADARPARRALRHLGAGDHADQRHGDDAGARGSHLPDPDARRTRADHRTDRRPRRLLPPSTPESLSAVDWPTFDSLYGPTASR